MLPKRTLGSNGPRLSAIGYGAMVLEGYYGAADEPDGSRADRKTFPGKPGPFARLKALAADYGLTPAQLALAWLFHQGPDIVPIPGTRKAARIGENTQAARVTLDDATLQRIDQLAPLGAAKGGNLVA